MALWVRLIGRSFSFAAVGKPIPFWKTGPPSEIALPRAFYGRNYGRNVQGYGRTGRRSREGKTQNEIRDKVARNKAFRAKALGESAIMPKKKSPEEKNKRSEETNKRKAKEQEERKMLEEPEKEESNDHPVVLKQDGQEYAVVLRMLGERQCEAMCLDGTKRLCNIRRKMRNEVEMAAGDVILVGLRPYHDHIADVVFHKYSPEEWERLIKGEPPKGSQDLEEDEDAESESEAPPKD